MRLISCYLVLAAGCQQDKPGPPEDTSPGNSEDTAPDSGECVAVQETPYDGIDQDCDGSDLVDVDADGAVANEAGGPDCDDADASIFPGASEVPYDGIDQDCDGADLTDVDGDGYSASAAGGDDCNDQDATIHPGADDTPADGIDQDCDGADAEDTDHGYVPDAIVCWDGTGDFDTIQAAVDGMPDGSVIKICPGTYVEYVLITDRVLTLYGGANDPHDVVLDGQSTGSAGFFVTGDAADVNITWLTILGGTVSPAVHTESAQTNIDTVDFCGDGYAGTRYAIETLGASAITNITRSLICNTDVRLEGSGEIRMSLFQDMFMTFECDYRDSDGGVGTTSWLIANSIFVQHADIQIADNGVFDIHNNTFADTDQIQFFFPVYYGASVSIMPSVALDSNILANSTGGSPFWSVYWVGYTDSGNGEPASFLGNVVWRMGSPLGQLQYCDTHGECSTDYSLSRWLEARGILADPAFEYSAEKGSYGLGAGSPAIDAGVGDADPDGSSNDAGAFGGPDGNWYLEVPWPLN